MTDSLHGATMGDKIPGGSQRKRFLNTEKISFTSLEEEGPDLRLEGVFTVPPLPPPTMLLKANSYTASLECTTFFLGGGGEGVVVHRLICMSRNVPRILNEMSQEF